MSASTFGRLTRRGFLSRAGAAAVFGAAGFAGYACRVEPHWVEFVRRNLPIANLPDALVGRTLVQISDIHVSPTVDNDYLIRTLKRVNEFAPDVVALTGDFITFNDGAELDHLPRVLEHLRPGRLATLAVLGNHDYGERWDNVAIGERVVHRLTGVGIDVLRNARREVSGLQVAGLDDLWGPFFEPERVMPHLDPSQPALVLCHNPDAADRQVWAGYRGWMLSGHTHGAQLRVPFFLPPIMPVRNWRYLHSETALPDGRHVYVNRGIGYSMRVRFRSRPEVTVFRLTRDESVPRVRELA
jgi:predicted MPP superfamily phosphohydrolase